jgi:hypothetical protein
VAAAIASDDREAPPDLRPQAERCEQVGDDQAIELQQLAAGVARLRADLRTATRRARAWARTSERLRRELLAARRSLARERQQ